MSLIEDIKQHYEHESYPPEGSDLDYDYVDGKWIRRLDGVETKRVSYEIIDDTPRWGDVIQVVLQRGDELVAIKDVKPGTELQDWGDYGDPEIYPVKAVQITVTKYERV